MRLLLLQTLYLQHNRLKQLPTGLTGLTCLRTLNLSSNVLRDMTSVTLFLLFTEYIETVLKKLIGLHSFIH